MTDISNNIFNGEDKSNHGTDHQAKKESKALSVIKCLKRSSKGDCININAIQNPNVDSSVSKSAADSHTKGSADDRSELQSVSRDDETSNSNSLASTTDSEVSKGQSSENCPARDAADLDAHESASNNDSELSKNHNEVKCPEGDAAAPNDLASASTTDCAVGDEHPFADNVQAKALDGDSMVAESDKQNHTNDPKKAVDAEPQSIKDNTDQKVDSEQSSIAKSAADQCEAKHDQLIFCNSQNHCTTSKCEHIALKKDFEHFKSSQEETNKAILQQLSEIKSSMDARFDKIEDKFKELDNKFEYKFKELDNKFEYKFKELDNKFEYKFKEFDNKFEGKFKELDNKFEGKFQELSSDIKELKDSNHAMDLKINNLNNKVSSINIWVKAHTIAIAVIILVAGILFPEFLQVLASKVLGFNY